MTDRPAVPARYVKPPSMLTSFRHRELPWDEKFMNACFSLCTGLPAGALLGTAAASLTSLVIVSPVATATAYGASIAVGMAGFYAKFCRNMMVGRDQRAMKDFTKKAIKSIGLVDEGPEGFHVDARSVIESKDPAMSELTRQTVIRLATVRDSYDRSKDNLGSSPKDEIDSMAREAVLSIVQDAIVKRDAILVDGDPDSGSAARNIAITMRGELEKAALLGSKDRPPDHVLSAGTGRATIDRLVMKAEEALAIDPDMVDAAGARVDAAIRKHLPRLLKAHSEAARHARVEDLSEADENLKTGVEQIRASLEEGLQTLRHEKADALRTEVGFLKLRRSGAEGPLRAIEDGMTE
jgi:hypothetical protein